MDFSSSSSSSSSHYRSSSSVSPANTTAPHFPPMETSSSSPQDAARFNYAYHYNYPAGASTAERREEAPDRPPEEEEKEREHMFDKIVTPSDVGKLNRLVIPKQHAEKYFPLDSSSSEKGLLLDFEDRSGKSWRFRYSYWNSSQSYVMTKGWSRFVKEKKLDAGDVVSFQRGVGEEAKDHFYIDWRRRPQPPHHPPPQIQFQHPPFLLRPPNLHYQTHAHAHAHPHPHPHHYRGSVIGYNGLLGNAAATNSSGYNYNYTDTLNYNYGGPNFFRQAGPVVYMRGPPPPQMQRSIPAASSPMVLESVPVVVPGTGAGQANAGTSLRLFGVNMVTDGQANRSADEEAVEEGRLQLSLIHGGSGDSSTTTTTTTDPLDKGKSSMSLDFDL